MTECRSQMPRERAGRPGLLRMFISTSSISISIVTISMISIISSISSSSSMFSIIISD